MNAIYKQEIETVVKGDVVRQDSTDAVVYMLVSFLTHLYTQQE